MKKQSGFTLIELLLVLAIIGIIAAIAVPAILGQRDKAKAKAVQSMVANIAGECARVNDSLKETNSATTAANVVTAVLSLSNYTYPNTKNPYGGNGPAFTSSGTAQGTVVLTSNDNYVDSATTLSYPAVVITGYFKGGSASKVVALD